MRDRYFCVTFALLPVHRRAGYAAEKGVNTLSLPGNWAEPYIMITLSMPHKMTTVLGKFCSYCFFITAHYATTARRSALKCNLA